eukprot:gnl/Chilomastix_cuspidata/3718.p1 GENE.gnl/Chilomastix_cuspidata/3718~~gnl/Chilomastix_cuspidata/3718.p1  ORF type:complete len:2150 (-),score=541.09 gnl/Chilomastix_cuspidata/3718:46-6495(-)
MESSHARRSINSVINRAIEQSCAPSMDFIRGWHRPPISFTPPARCGHTITVHNERIFMFGGETVAGQQTNDLYILDLTTGKWRKEAGHCPAPPPRAHHTASLSGQSLYVFGGISGQQFLSDLWRFDLQRGGWEELRALSQSPPAMYHHGAAALDDQLVVYGGVTGSPLHEQHSGRTWVYNTSQNQWREVLPLSPSGKLHATVGVRFGHTITNVHGRILMYGGRDPQAKVSQKDEIWEFHAAARNWRVLNVQGARKPPARFGHVAATVGTGLLIGCGEDARDGRHLDDWWFFDPAQLCWHPVDMGSRFARAPFGGFAAAPLRTVPQPSPERDIRPCARSYLAAAAVSTYRGPRLFVFGGFSKLRGAMQGDTWFMNPHALGLSARFLGPSGAVHPLHGLSSPGTARPPSARRTSPSPTRNVHAPIPFSATSGAFPRIRESAPSPSIGGDGSPMLLEDESARRPEVFSSRRPSGILSPPSRLSASLRQLREEADSLSASSRKFATQPAAHLVDLESRVEQIERAVSSISASPSAAESAAFSNPRAASVGSPRRNTPGGASTGGALTFVTDTKLNLRLAQQAAVSRAELEKIRAELDAVSARLLADVSENVSGEVLNLVESSVQELHLKIAATDERMSQLLESVGSALESSLPGRIEDVTAEQFQSLRTALEACEAKVDGCNGAGAELLSRVNVLDEANGHLSTALSALRQERQRDLQRLYGDPSEGGTIAGAHPSLSELQHQQTHAAATLRNLTDELQKLRDSTNGHVAAISKRIKANHKESDAIVVSLGDELAKLRARAEATQRGLKDVTTLAEQVEEGLAVSFSQSTKKIEGVQETLEDALFQKEGALRQRIEALEAEAKTTIARLDIMTRSMGSDRQEVLEKLNSLHVAQKNVQGLQAEAERTIQTLQRTNFPKMEETCVANASRLHNIEQSIDELRRTELAPFGARTQSLAASQEQMGQRVSALETAGEALEGRVAEAIDRITATEKSAEVNRQGIARLQEASVTREEADSIFTRKNAEFSDTILQPAITALRSEVSERFHSTASDVQALAKTVATGAEEMRAEQEALKRAQAEASRAIGDTTKGISSAAAERAEMRAEMQALSEQLGANSRELTSETEKLRTEAIESINETTESLTAHFSGQFEDLTTQVNANFTKIQERIQAFMAAQERNDQTLASSERKATAARQKLSGEVTKLREFLIGEVSKATAAFEVQAKSLEVGLRTEAASASSRLESMITGLSEETQRLSEETNARFLSTDSSVSERLETMRNLFMSKLNSELKLLGSELRGYVRDSARDLSGRINEDREFSKTLERRVSSMIGDRSKLDVRSADALNDLQTAREEEIRTTSSAISALQTEVKTLRGSTSNLQNSVTEALNGTVMELQGAVHAVSGRFSEATLETEERLCALEKALAQQEPQTDEIHVTLNALQKSIEKLQAESSTDSTKHSAGLADMKLALSTLSAGRSTQAGDIEQLSAQLSTLSDALREEKATVAKLKLQVKDVQKGVGDLESLGKVAAVQDETKSPHLSRSPSSLMSRASASHWPSADILERAVASKVKNGLEELVSAHVQASLDVFSRKIDTSIASIKKELRGVLFKRLADLEKRVLATEAAPRASAGDELKRLVVKQAVQIEALEANISQLRTRLNETLTLLQTRQESNERVSLSPLSKFSSSTTLLRPNGARAVSPPLRHAVSTSKAPMHPRAPSVPYVQPAPAASLVVQTGESSGEIAPILEEPSAVAPSSPLAKNSSRSERRFLAEEGIHGHFTASPAPTSPFEAIEADAQELDARFEPWGQLRFTQRAVYDTTAFDDQPLAVCAHPSAGSCAVAVGCQSGSVRLFHVPRALELLRAPRPDSAEPATPTAQVELPNAQPASKGRSSALPDISRVDAVLHEFTDGSEVLSVAQQGDLIAAGGREQVCLWSCPGLADASKYDLSTLAPRLVTGAPLRHHSGIVYSVDLRGNLLVTGSRDRTVQVFSAREEKVKSILRGHKRCVYVAKMRDEVIASGSGDHTAKLWAAARGVCTATLQGHVGRVRALAFAPQGLPVLATGSSDQSIRLWDTRTHAATHVLKGHTDHITELFLDEVKLVSTSQDGTVRVWDTRKGLACVQTLQAHDGLITSASLRAETLFTCSNKGPVLALDFC